MATTSLKKIKLKKIKELGEKLYEARQAINAADQEYDKKVSGLKEQRDLFQQELVDSLKKVGISSIRVNSGDSFVLARKPRYAFTSETLALKWATENHCVRPDSELVRQKLNDQRKAGAELPSFVKVEETEYISVIKAKKENE